MYMVIWICIFYWMERGTIMWRIGLIQKPLHSFLDLGIDGLANTEEMNNRLVSLPIYPGLSNEDIENIHSPIDNNWLSANGTG